MSESEAMKLMRHWLNQGWTFREIHLKSKEDRSAYKSRVELELQMIGDKDFENYFLVLSDAVRWAKSEKIPVGPARGSAAASLVCYLLRITEVDPMRFPHMLFERFIDPTRTELPDVDLDFSDDRRIEVKRYLERKYGKDHVGNIGNFTRYRGKNSIDDVARVYGIPAWECNTIKDLIIERSGGDSRISDSLQDTFDMFPKAQDVLDRYPQLQNAVRLEGNYRGMGVHAAGIVISNSPITDTCAVYTRERDGEEVSVIAYDKKDGEYVGMLKADFLGLTTMGMIGLAIDMIGMDLEDLYRIPLTDQPTLDAFRRGDLTGIFQFEGRATRIVCSDVEPDHFQHLADINALSRPGPLFSGMTAAYAEVKHGRAEPGKLHPIVDAISDWTYGQIVYQEQVLRVIREVGGFPMSDVHAIRRIISQKLGEAQFEKLFAQFERGAKELHGIDSDLALKIWRFLSTSATYSFCVTGDTLLERAGKGIHCDDEFVSVAELYDLQNNREDKIPMSDKIRSGRMKILGMDDDCRIRPNNLIKIHDPVEIDCYRLTTDTGRSITISKDHSMLTSEGYKRTKDLIAGMKVVVSLGKEGRQKEIQDQYRAKHSGQKYGSWCGMSGSGNPAWLDGRSSALIQAQKETYDRDEAKCQHCGKDDDENHHTLEFAHIMTLTDLGGDYLKYHSARNMMLLCNSCHKKFDYRIQGTRVPRWTRGRPTGLETIVSIEYAGVQPVYDISMAGPSHNYQGNGFIHHNNISHCISYSMLAFWQMWIKVHHPTAFYAAQLQKVNDEKRMKLMQDCLRHDIQILPPDIQTSGKTWSAPSEGMVRAGFLQIPGIGPKTSEAVVNWRNDRIGSPTAKNLDQNLILDVEVVEDSVSTSEQKTAKESANLPVAQRIGSTGDVIHGQVVELTWDDMIEIKGIGPKTIDKIKDFATAKDPFGLNKVADLFKSLRSVLVPDNDYLIPVPTHVSETIPKNGKHMDIVWMGIPKAKNYQDYVENQRSRYGKDIDEIIKGMKDPHLVKSCVVQCFDDYEGDVYCRWNRWQFPKFEEMLESLQTDGSNVLIVKGMKQEDFGISLHVKEAYVLELDEEERL